MPPKDTESSNGLIRFVRQNQLVVFVVLAYALSWWAWIWYRLDPGNVDAPILPIGPLLAALIVLAMIGGWPAIKGLLCKIVHWRVGWKWYALVLLLPVALTLSAFAINLLLGAQRVAGIEVPDAGQMAVRFVFIFLWIGLGEEPGWRGFALPRLLVGRTALAAAVILGLIHLVWHAPLYGVEYDSANVWPWGISVVCYSIVVCWIYLHTGGSLSDADAHARLEQHDCLCLADVRRRRPAPPVVDMVRLVGDCRNRGGPRHGAEPCEGQAGDLGRPPWKIHARPLSFTQSRWRLPWL